MATVPRAAGQGKPIKVVQVVAFLHAGGSEQVAVNLACGLAQRGHECWVVAIAKPAQSDSVRAGLLREMASASVRVVEFDGTSLRRACFTGALRLAALCRSVQPDIVHSHTDHPDFAVGLASCLTRINKVRTIHNNGIWPTHWWAGGIAESAFKDELVVCISRASQEAYLEIRRRYRRSQSRHEVLIPNGIPLDAAEQRFDRSAVVRLVGTDPGRLLLCFAGRFTYQKGFDVLISAMERLPISLLDRLEVHAFGQGEELSGYVARVQLRRLPIYFHTTVHRISRMFSGFDAVVMPSRYEGLPLVALESLAAGVPLIASTAPGLIEVLPPDWPLSVPPEDPDALAAALVEFASEGFDPGDLGRRAAAWAKDRFGLEPMVAAYEAAYRSFLECRVPNDADCG